MRRALDEAHDGRRPSDHVLAVGVMHGGGAFAGEQEYGDALRRDEREQQHKREPAGEAPRHRPHARSTLPAKR